MLCGPSDNEMQLTQRTGGWWCPGGLSSFEGRFAPDLGVGGRERG
jgi:hypothetical protein